MRRHAVQNPLRAFCRFADQLFLSGNRFAPPFFGCQPCDEQDENQCGNGDQRCANQRQLRDIFTSAGVEQDE